MEVDEDELCSKLLCYACLCVGRDVYKLTDENLLQYYLDVLDEMPLKKSRQFVNYMVCWECKAALQKCCAFREQIKDSYRLLQSYTKKNFHKCLKTGTSKPPRLKISPTECVDIPPIYNEVICEVPTVEVVKTDQDDDWESLKDGSTNGLDDDVSNTIDNDEEFDSELQNIMSSFDSDKKRKEITNRVKRSKKKNLKQKFEVCIASDMPLTVTEHQDLETIAEVKTELGDHWETQKDTTNDLNEDNIDTIDNNHISKSRELESELQNIMLSMEKGDKKKNREVKSKVKKSKKVLKSLKLQKQKRPKYEPKVLTIELSYEEMLIEREKESTRDAYVNAQFKCETCLIGFHYKKSYQAHINSKHLPELGEYICPICKTIISSVDSFTYHYKRHMRRYECGICQKRTTDLKVMQQHYYSAHEISLKEYTCNICGQISNSIDAHRYHKDSHKARVECKQCDKTFRHRAGLMNHRLAVHECHNAFPCTVCDKVFRWKTSLKRHLEKHEAKDKCTSAAPYCSMCRISFASICSYQRHMKNSLKHVSQDQLKYICDDCNRRFSDKTKLRDHIEEKHLHKTYQCHICSKPSKNRVGLDQHIRNVHKGRPKNKMCHHCGRGFPTTMQLESHIRTHTGERPFVCEYCQTSFSQKSNWYKHYRQVHLNIKSKRYPMSKKRVETTDQVPKVPVVEKSINPVETDPYRPIVLQYSPERGFVM